VALPREDLRRRKVSENDEEFFYEVDEQQIDASLKKYAELVPEVTYRRPAVERRFLARVPSFGERRRVAYDTA